MAVALAMDGGTVPRARLVLGVVASQPREALDAAPLLEGQSLSPQLIERVADAAARPATPPPLPSPSPRPAAGSPFRTAATSWPAQSRSI